MTEKENNRRCFKCGCSPAEDNVKLFRFPKPGVRNLVRCKLWAKFVFPERDSNSRTLQNKLHNEHRMLCQQHFNDQDFIDDSKQRLLRYSVPCDREKNSPKTEVPDRIDVPVDHEYVIRFTHDKPTKNIDLSPESTSSIYSEDKYNTIRFNNGLIEDLNNLTDQDFLNTLSLPDQCDQASKLEDLSAEETLNASSLPNQTEQQPEDPSEENTDQCEQTTQFEDLRAKKTLEASSPPDQNKVLKFNDPPDQTILKVYRHSHNREQAPQNKELLDHTAPKTPQLPHEQAPSSLDDSYTRFGQYIGNELRKYDETTLVNVKKAIRRVINEADTKIKQQTGD